MRVSRKQHSRQLILFDSNVSLSCSSLLSSGHSFDLINGIFPNLQVKISMRQKEAKKKDRICWQSGIKVYLWKNFQNLSMIIFNGPIKAMLGWPSGE